MGQPTGDLTESFDVGRGGTGELRFLPLERWRLQRLIGQGGQANVWLAEDLELGQDVVLKVFRQINDPVAMERMRREVRLGRELRHPGLVRIFDLVEMSGFLVAVMEWIPGGSLGGLLEATGPLSVDRVVEIAGQVLETLAYLHGEGVIHRDIKPSNLLLADDGRVLLADLGLARRLDGGEDLTRILTVVGTPAYMAPEQLRGEEPTPAVDLYGLGVTLYRLLTGEPPFPASSEFEMADAILHRRARPIRTIRKDCPRWFASFVDRLLERSPADRFPDGAVALAAFERRRAVGSRRRRRWAAAAFVAAGLVLGAGMGLGRWVASPAPLNHVDQVEGRLVAYDASGRELWRHRVPGNAGYVLADVMGSEEPEVVLDHVDPAGKDHSRVAVDILGHGGKVAGSVILLEGPWLGPLKTTADWQLSGLDTADVDGDGKRDLVWIVTHRVWFPAGLGVWAPRGKHGPGYVFVNAGSLQQFAAADLDGDGRQEIVAAGLNNPLGFQKIVAVVRPGFYAGGPGIDTQVSPDLKADEAGSFGGRGSGRLTYVPLGSRLGQCTALHAGPEGLEIRFGARVVHLDRDGNPEDSPLYGTGWEKREAFWNGLAVLCRTLRIAEPSGLEDLWRDFKATYRDVLSEPPSETAAALLAARSMADGGDPLRAARLLEATARRIPEERDLLMRAGEYRLIAGDRDHGQADLRGSLPLEPGGRNPYDQFLLLGLDAVVHGDQAAFAAALRANSSVAPVAAGHNTVEKLRPALLWAEGRWQDPRVRQMRGTLVLPILGVLGLWEGLESGDDPSRIVAEAQRLEKDSEVPEMARLLRAAAELKLGHAAVARGLAESVVEAMDRKGRRSYELSCWRPLACLVAAEAAEASGGSPLERRWLREAAAAGPSTWYGRRAAGLLAHLPPGEGEEGSAS